MKVKVEQIKYIDTFISTTSIKLILLVSMYFAVYLSLRILEWLYLEIFVECIVDFDGNMPNYYYY